MCDRRVTSLATFTRNVEIRRRAFVSRDYTGVMHERRMTYGATIRLALVFSAVAAVIAIGLRAIGDVSTIRLVVAVAVIGFATSWVQSGRVTHPEPCTMRTAPRHRVTVMPMRQPIG
jgi:hypothetical protein